MFKHVILGLSLSIGAAALMPQVSIAQTAELTAEEIAERLKNQKTRGLVLAPSNKTETTSTNEAVETETLAQQNYVELAPDEQVSVQISFDFDSSALRPDQKPKLATLCQVIQTVDVEVFRIVGHTDSSGSASYNERLSLLRAQEVKRHLEGDCGIAPNRLEAVGVGEAFPLDKQDPRGDVNRRVEFQALS
ncbi:MAG: OmpA family protein [Pseudomonadota bacterium]